MNQDRNAVYWSIPLGTWFAVQLRLSVFFLILVLFFCHRLESWPLGVTFSLVLFFSVLLHEFGHVIAARATGGDGDEIIITPFGGLATCAPAPTFTSRFGTVAGGPLVNLVLCLIALIPVMRESSAIRSACFNPFDFPAVNVSGLSGSEWVAPLFVLLFKANWLLLLINLLPVHPLDGGRMLRHALTAKLEAYVARNVYLTIGAICGLMLLGFGLWHDYTWLMLIGAIVLPLNVAERYQMQYEEESDESFLGYDFSQGYTSLERSDGTGSSGGEKEASPGMLERWRTQREEARRQHAEEEEREMEVRLDELLQKLHTQGESSLTPAEKRQLQEISARLRDRGGDS